MALLDLFKSKPNETRALDVAHTTDRAIHPSDALDVRYSNRTTRRAASARIRRAERREVRGLRRLQNNEPIETL